MCSKMPKYSMTKEYTIQPKLNKGEKYCCADCHLHSRKPFGKFEVCKRDEDEKEQMGGMSSWFSLFPSHSDLSFLLISGPGLTKIPMRTDLAANWTTSLNTQFHTRNGSISLRSETGEHRGYLGPAVTVAEAAIKETAHWNTHLICGL